MATVISDPCKHSMDTHFFDQSEEFLKTQVSSEYSTTTHSLLSTSTSYTVVGVHTNNQNIEYSHIEIASNEKYEPSEQQCNINSDYGIDETDFGFRIGTKKHSETPCKILVIGNKGAGKTSLAQALTSSKGIAGGQTKLKEKDGLTVYTSNEGNEYLKIYDIAQDLDSLECHSLFMTNNALYILCFDVRCFAVCSKKIDTTSIIDNWLDLLAIKAPNSRIIIVATHIDNDVVDNSFLNGVWENVEEILNKHKEKHLNNFENQKLSECFLCQEEKLSRRTSGELVGSVSAGELLPEINRKFKLAKKGTNKKSSSGLPHVVGYFEVSNTYQMPQKINSFKNQSIRKLREKVISVSKELLSSTLHKNKKWSSIIDAISGKNENIIDFHNFCQHLQIPRHLKRYKYYRKVANFLEQDDVLFFHTEGNFEKCIIPNPIWLSNQLRKLLSYEDSIGNTQKGFISMEQFKTFFEKTSPKECQNLFSLLNEAGYVVKVSSTKIMIPICLPVGMPNCDQWPLNHDEKEINYLFHFNNLPRQFFPQLIAQIDRLNLKYFTGKMKPLYRKNNILYNTKYPGIICEEHGHKDHKDQRHRISFRLFQEKHEIILSVVGSYPCCIANDLVELINRIQKESFPAVAMNRLILCGICIKYCYPNPCYFEINDMKITDPVCEIGHDLISWENVKQGIYKFKPNITVRAITKALEDTDCPKLFFMSPINKEKLNLPKRFEAEYVYHRYTVQLLCELPNAYHIVGSGYGLKSPKQFIKKYGKRIYSMLKFVSALKTPLSLSGLGGGFAEALETVDNLANNLHEVLYDFKDEFSFAENLENLTQNDCQKYLNTNENLSRRELKRFLNELDQNQNFGDLIPTYIGDSIYWLCKEHSKWYQCCNE